MTTHDHDHENEIVPFAQTNYRGKPQRFGIKTDDRRRHVYLIGKTGMGKTSMLEQFIIHDIMAGHGIAYLDPHGDTASKILDFIPSYRVNDVIHFNPADLEWPIAFNVLEQVDRSHQHLVASGLIGIFKKIWADSWGPRLEYVLRNAILALMDFPGSTLLGIMRILVDKEYRRKVIAKVQDPVVKSFWVDEYARYPDKFQTEAIAPIQNKVGQFLSSPLVRNIVGQVRSTIDIRKVMDEGKILIMNLAKGGVGEDNSALLGAMMVTKVYLAAMERVDQPEHERRDFFLYVDEFQNFATDSFANILSEARKYRLNLTIAHQYIGQLMTETSTRVRDAVYGNVGTLVCFRVGAQDAEFLEPEFTPRFLQEDLVNLAKYNVYMKLMINGVSSDPFSASTLPPIELQHEQTGNREKVLRASRERYARPRQEIEEKIARWTGMASDGEAGGEESGGPMAAARAKVRELTEGLPKAPPSGGWLRQAMRGAMTTGVDASEQPAGVRKVIQESQRPERPPPEPRQVECAKCGGMATVFFRPRPGQRILCESCLRAEKERAKIAKYEKPQPRPQGAGKPVSGIRHQDTKAAAAPHEMRPSPSQRPMPPSGVPRSPTPYHPQSSAPRGAKPPPAPPLDTLEPIERGGGGEVSLGDILLRPPKGIPGASKEPPSKPPSQESESTSEGDEGKE